MQQTCWIKWIRFLTVLVCSSCLSALAAESDDFDTFEQQGLEFNDQVLEEPLEYPDWFTISFLDLRDDLENALKQGKRGIAVYFGQKRCAYCKALMEVNFGEEDIVAYTRKYFDFIPIDIWGIDEVTDLDGKVLTEREYAIREGTNFTPSIIFYDAAGDIALRLRGYYPPYKFRAALEYAADGHYLDESFPDFLDRADPPMSFEPGGLNEEDFFSQPPHNLSRNVRPSDRPLAVFFEQGNCYACNVLHGTPLQDSVVENLLNNFDAAQFSIYSNEPVVTPEGKQLTAKQWAHELGIFYTPTLIFFNEIGQEILRVDSVIQIYRLRNVLTYISTKAYLNYPTYSAWRLQVPTH